MDEENLGLTGPTNEDEFVSIPTPSREQEIAENTGQVGFKENLALGHRQTALHAGIRKVQDEAPGNFDNNVRNVPEFEELSAFKLVDGVYVNTETGNLPSPRMQRKLIANYAFSSVQALLGKTGEGDDLDYDKSEHVSTLIEGIPRKYHNDILANNSLEAATRARARVLEDLADEETIALQRFGGATRFASSLVDADLPLVFASGGAFGSRKLAANTIKSAAALKIGARGQRFLSATTVGASGGAQSGLLVGLASTTWREGSGTSDVVNYTLLGTLGGAVLLGTGRALGDTINPDLRKLADDFADRVVDNDPTLHADPYIPDGDPVPPAVFTPDAPATPEFKKGDTVTFSGVGAEATDIPEGLSPVVFDDTVENLSDAHKDLVNKAHRANYDADFYNQRDKDKNNIVQRISNSKWATGTGTGTQGKWYNSASPLLNYVGQTIFENGSGFLRGKNTAGILEPKYIGRIQTQLEGVRGAAYNFAKKTGDTVAFGQGITQKGIQKFNREILLERNRRSFGRGLSEDPDVRLAADGYDNAALEAHRIGKGRDGEQAIDGFNDLPPNANYTPIKWGGKLGSIIRDAADKVGTERALVKGLVQSYRAAGIAAGRDAEAIAKAVVSRAKNNDAGIDVSLIGLLQGDGRDILRKALIDDGVGEEAIDGLLKRLVGDLSERSKAGFAKGRNEIDLETTIDLPDGSQIQVVDLVSNDLTGDWQRYSRQLAGSAALSRHGITNRAQRSEIIDAILTEQRRVGDKATFTRGELEALFSSFDGGARKGHHWGMGDEAKPQAEYVTHGKRAVQLAYLGKLGFTQAGETGGTIVQVGLANWANRGVFPTISKPLRDGNKRVLKELAALTGSIGKDEHHLAPHLQLDEINAADAATLSGKLKRWSNNAAYVQGYTSFFNQVRSWQQKTASLSIMDNIMQSVKKDLDRGGLTEKNLLRLWSDFGLDAEDITRLGELVQSGKIEFKTTGTTTFVDKLNMDDWDAALAETFSSAVVRNTHAVVQKALAGEEDAWMSSTTGSLLTHLKTFPMQATQKQFARHFRHNDGKAYAAVGYTFATAYLASMVRSGLDGKDPDSAFHAKRAFSYSNMTGFIPMAYDPLMTVLGMEDKRFSQFNAHSDITPPVLSFANDAIRLPGALGKAALGQADGSDRQAVRTLPFSNTILYGEMINGLASRNRNKDK